VGPHNVLNELLIQKYYIFEGVHHNTFYNL